MKVTTEIEATTGASAHRAANQPWLTAMLGMPRMVAHGLRQHALSSAITIGSVALASGLLFAVFSIQAQARTAFTAGAGGFDAVLGARGSQLQLVLNVVFHLETSPGNIPWNLYQSIKGDTRVMRAVPYALGDNYRGYRIVGTTREWFTADKRLKEGRLFEEAAHDAVVGSFAAQRTGLRVGDGFHPYHGLFFREGLRHKEQYKVVGILQPTNSPADRVIWIPIEGVYRMQGHVLRGSGTVYEPQEDLEIPDEHKEVSAVMLKLASPQAGIALDQLLNKQGKVATLAWPIGKVMAELFDKLGWMHHVLAGIAYLVLLVVAGSIVSSITNSIEQRRRDFAIMRALGARRSTVFALILGEATAMAAIGALLGWVIYLIILVAVAWVVRSQAGVILSAAYFHPVLVLGPLGIVLLGALAGVIPALKAYRTDVISYLTPAA